VTGCDDGGVLWEDAAVGCVAAFDQKLGTVADAKLFDPVFFDSGVDALLFPDGGPGIGE
jgi:hypothetical protein